MPVELSIVTPERPVVEAAVESVVAPGQQGEFGVLTGHEPLLAPLQPGVVRYEADGIAQRVAVSGGFAEVSGERVTLLARTAEPSAEIDAGRAREAREGAAAALAELGPVADAVEIESRREALARAEARLAALEG